MIKREDLNLNLQGVDVGAFLTVPEDAEGLVLFAHGSGSSRHSSRNQFVAEVLQEAGLATLLLDLLAVSEATDRANVFDIDLLANRLILATEWASANARLQRLPIGYFGASTGAAAALRAASVLSDKIRAVVSRGGRPDLAIDDLVRVRAPTLLIVGGHDYGVIELNRRAYERLTGAKDFSVIPRATHLFEEPGALEEVADLARDWFLRFLPHDHRISYYQVQQPANPTP